MNLLQRTAKVVQEIQQVKSLKELAVQANKVEKRSSDLAGPARSLDEMGDTITLFVSQSIPVTSIDKALIGALKKRIDDLRERYSANKSAILDPFPDEDIKHVFTKPLEQVPQKIRPALQEAWRNWAGSQLPEVDKDVLAILDGIPSLRDSVATVVRLQNSAVSMCNTLPTDDGDLKGLQKLGTEMTDAWHNLTGEGVPDSVLRFLRGAGSREGAPFDSLTPEVLDWLNAHNIRNSMRIRMA